MASDDSLAFFTSANAEPPETNYATLGSRVGTGDTDGQVILSLLFDAATDEHIDFRGHMPDHYAGGGLTLKISFASSSATSGNAVITAAFKSITDDADDLDTKAFAAANSVTKATASAAGEEAVATITFTDGADMDSVAGNEDFYLRISRDANNGSDTLSGDMEFRSVALSET